MKMKRIILAFAVATMAMGMQSCGQTRPENNDGHNLWLGDITAPVNAPLKEKLSRPVYLYGIENEKCDFRAVDIKETNGSCAFTVLFNGESQLIEMPCVGVHNVMNA